MQAWPEVPTERPGFLVFCPGLPVRAVGGFIERVEEPAKYDD